MKPKIAIIIERSDVALGGAERSVSELAEAIGAIGYETHIIAAKGKATAPNVHILCADVLGKRTSFKVFARELKKHIGSNHYDVVHSVLPFDFADIYQPRSGTFAESIIRKASTYRFAVVQSLKRNTAFLNFRRTAWFNAERRLAEAQTGPLVVAISNYVAGQFRSHYHIPENRMVVISNGIKPAGQISKSLVDSLKSALLAQLCSKETENPVLFLFAGHDFKRKGLDCLVEAFGKLWKTDNHIPAMLIIAGRGNSAAYRRLAAKLGVEEKILFIGDVGNVQELIAATDVAVLPTFDDPCSRFILEALAAGKPVITTKFNGAIDLFTDNRHGRAVGDPRDITALSEALRCFTNRDNLNRAANAIVSDNLRQNVSVARVAQQLKAVYDKILEKRSQR
jgi:UDP-glucose:(heptosyl)LPS alpha-1,3-glucosyltransferase